MAFGLLFLWSLWAYAFQGLLGSSGAVGLAVPDLGLVLVVVLSGRLEGARAWAAVLLLAAARISLSGDPPIAVFAGLLFIFGAARWFRRTLDLERPIPIGVFSGAAAVAFMLWLEIAQEARLAGAGVFPELTAADLWCVALATGLVGLGLGRSLTRLPGLGPLMRRNA